MISLETGKVEFEVIIYGLPYEEALRVPCPEIHALAERYPSYTSSPFLIYPGEEF